MLFAYLLCCSPHRRLHRLARSVHQQFCDPFEDFLNQLRLRLEKIIASKGDSNVGNAAGDLLVGLDLD